MSQQPPWRLLLGLCCVCGQPVYRDQNPFVDDQVRCALRHRECQEPKKKAS